ncbi:unnamed protein product [Ilex paraguariensis]|uniref:FBD domain-containing protein n=1 Tax=Ilex paraguariensis TaxID=185542 RepID=A0ABC8TYS6_9AQUA
MARLLRALPLLRKLAVQRGRGLNLDSSLINFNHFEGSSGTLSIMYPGMVGSCKIIVKLFKMQQDNGNNLVLNILALHIIIDLIAESLHYEQKSVEEIGQCVHTHLKEVELSGFSGTWSHMECAIYLLRNAVALNQMVIDPWYYTGLDLSVGPYRHRWAEGVWKNIYHQLLGYDYSNANVVVRYNQRTQPNPTLLMNSNV